MGDLLSEGYRLDSIPITSGILQGSVPRTILFTLYMVPLGDICRRNEIEFHLYAEDTQIYITFKPGVSNSKSDCIARIEKSIEEINIQMSQNLLKLNSDKTEFIPFGMRQQLSKVGDISLCICNDTVIPVNHVRNLGYIMDTLLKNGPHINKITSSRYCMLHDIAKVRPCLDTKTVQLIIQSLVLSHIDYCNLLLAGSAQSNWINSNIFSTWAVKSSVISENKIMFLQP